MKVNIKKKAKKIIFQADTILCRIFLDLLVKKGKYTRVHISFDDVFESLKNIESNGSMITVFSKWNKEYGLKVHLYLFYEQDGQQIAIDKLWNLVGQDGAFIANSNLCAGGGTAWLTYAPHEPENIDKLIPLIDKNYVSSSVRFHNYKCNEREIVKATECGMNVFLCDDLKRISYDLTPQEVTAVNKRGFFTKNGRTYIKTNIRLERPVFWHFIKSRRFDTLVIFGHEWAFDDDKERLEIILKALSKNNIIFV